MGSGSHIRPVVLTILLQASILIFGAPALAQTAPQTGSQLEETLRLAEGGDAAAQNLVGTIHQFGVGVPRNLESAAKWYERAAAQESAEAQVNMGAMHMTGEGVVQDCDRGVDLLRLSADQGLPLAIARLGHAYVMGQGVPMDRREGLRLLGQASDLGDGLAALQIGYVHLYGYDAPVDRTEAIRWFAISAERGYAVGQYVHAQYLPEGPERLSWIGKAAHVGYPPAQYALGKDMLDEASDRHDPDTAVAWLREAADGGNSMAEQTLFGMGLPGADGRTALNRDPYVPAREWTRQEMEKAVIAVGVAFGVALILLDGPDTRPAESSGSSDCQPGGPCGGMCPFGHVLIAGRCVFKPPPY